MTETATGTDTLATLKRASRAATGARSRLHAAVRQATADGASLRAVAAAAGCSVEQVRRILDGRAK